MSIKRGAIYRIDFGLMYQSERFVDMKVLTQLSNTEFIALKQKLDFFMGYME